MSVSSTRFFDGMPNELVAEIAKFIEKGYPGVLANTAVVCKSWKNKFIEQGYPSVLARLFNKYNMPIYNLPLTARDMNGANILLYRNLSRNMHSPVMRFIDGSSASLALHIRDKLQRLPNDVLELWAPDKKKIRYQLNEHEWAYREAIQERHAPHNVGDNGANYFRIGYGYKHIEPSKIERILSGQDPDFELVEHKEHKESKNS